MRINHNLSSMTAQTASFRVQRDMSKSLEKLSTGLRINKSADDAAGLGVSENLRTQVRGMQQAFRNTQDTISMLQIADGALNEQANILQRMRELVIQAKNDTYTSTERGYMSQEFSGLMEELDRIASVTNYNGMNIFAAPEMTSGIEGATMYSGSDYAGTPHTAVDARDIWDDASDSVFGDDDYASAHHFNMMIGANFESIDSDAYNATVESFDKASNNMLTIQFGQMDSNSLLGKDPSTALGNASVAFEDFDWNNGTPFDIGDMLISMAYHGAPDPTLGSVQDKFDLLLKVIDGNDADLPDSPLLRSGNGAAGSTHNATGLNRIGKMRSTIGAMINRLEHSSNNLMNQIINTQAAETVLRDVDFATEAAQLTRNQILSQSSTAMLAQSNMVTQGVLGLLG